VYSLTNSPEWLHGGLWYFQPPQLFTLAKSMNVLDRIVVVSSEESFEDDVIIALNGQEVMSLVSFLEINLKSVRSCTEGGKSDVRCNKINVRYGYAKQGFQSQANVYAFAYSYPNATHNYDNNYDYASSSSNHSTVGDSSGGVSNDDYEDNDDDAKDANDEANNDDATNAMKVPFVRAPIAKRTTAMRMTMIIHLPMPLLLLAPQ
jgi:hypothetical protein